MSVNVERILKFRGLPERAQQTLLLLLSAVVVSVICLIPGQTAKTLGVELLVIGVVFGSAIGFMLTKTVTGEHEYARPAFHLGLLALGTLPMVIGATSLIVGSGGGLYWIVAGILGAIVGGSINAWVLLVEILR